MDPRIFLQKVFKSNLDNAYMIRNAGGRASDDAIRSLIISHKLLKTKEWYVIHHTDCGMQKFDNKVMGCLLKHSLEPAKLVVDCNETLHPIESVCVCKWKDRGKHPGNSLGKYINWLPILDGLRASVIEDVKTIRDHPLVPSNVPIYGFIYDMVNDKLIKVPKADKIGRGKPLSSRCCNKRDKVCKC